MLGANAHQLLNIQFNGTQSLRMSGTDSQQSPERLWIPYCECVNALCGASSVISRNHQRYQYRKRRGLGDQHMVCHHVFAIAFL